jgi:HAE1 family hydrophobic/amphiphilic exporter-1
LATSPKSKKWRARARSSAATSAASLRSPRASCPRLRLPRLATPCWRRLDAELAGEESQRVQTTSELRWAAVLALVLVFMVLAGTFESLLQPVTVLSAIPLSLIGVAIVLVPVGQPIGVMAMIGLVMLAGVSVNDAILLADKAQRLIREGVERRRALALAASQRLRPIVMTTCTTVLALVPLAIGSGEAAQLRSPMAWTVIGGLIVATIGSLSVTPCLYLVLDRMRWPFRARAAA